MYQHILLENFRRYTSLAEQTYINTNTSLNIYLKVLEHFNNYISQSYWSIESSIKLKKNISKLKTIFDFLYRENNCCYKNNNHKNNITIDNLFNIFEAQGVIMATENIENLSAKGLPNDAATNTNTYTVILTLLIKSNNTTIPTIPNIGFKLPYVINFSSSIPTLEGSTNNYRYNP
jgi:hypothetical protein